MRIDLHAHSTASDGTDSPAELMLAAKKAGLDVVAITDHDTTAGWAPAVEALPSGLSLVRGAELSCIVIENGESIGVHLLAYLFDATSPGIITEQRRLRVERRNRFRAMATSMAADGLPIDIDEIFGLLPEDAPVGRPHLAQALLRAGLVTSVDEAFAQYLSHGRGYYLPRQDTPIEQAIEMISAAGGVTVLAHPFANRGSAMVSPEMIGELTRIGLTGIEVDHSKHTPAARKQLRELAAELGLLRTGSSDYHGTNKTVVLGEETTHPAQFEELVARASGVPIVVG